jgi:hypothetical protein
MADRSGNKAEVRRKQQELRQLLNEWDPIGVMPGQLAPSDEYDCLLGVLVRQSDPPTALYPQPRPADTASSPRKAWFVAPGKSHEDPKEADRGSAGPGIARLEACTTATALGSASTD